jgi:peptidoglycan/LPS O-acetylase OafA/YrhL
MTHAPTLESKIAGLDGLRGISIALVLFGHLATTNNFPSFFDKPYFTSMGNIGVRLFFTISGFLITTLLLRETAKTNRISLTDFYWRRSFRIFPAALFYILVMWIAYLLGFIDLRERLASKTLLESAAPDLIHALTFTYNYVSDYSWQFNHLWSLSVEEQFYLLWPMILALLGWRIAGLLAIACLVLCPIIRTMMLFVFDMPMISLSRQFQAVADSLFMGCIGAIYYNRINENYRLNQVISIFGGALGIGLILAAYASALWSRPFSAIAGQSIANLGGLLFLLHVVGNQTSLLGRLSQQRWLVYLGTISYSLYLWQQPFLDYHLKTWATSFPVNIILAFVLAHFSFHIVEKPVRKWGTKLQPSNQSGQ